MDQVISGGTFQTKLRVKRQTFRPSQASQEQIAEATEQAGSGSDGTSSTGTPPRERLISARKIDRLNQRVGGLVFLIDGQSQE